MFIDAATAIAAYTTAVLGESLAEANARDYGLSFDAQPLGAYIWTLTVTDELGDTAHAVITVHVPSIGQMKVGVFADGIQYDPRTVAEIEAHGK